MSQHNDGQPLCGDALRIDVSGQQQGEITECLNLIDAGDCEAKERLSVLVESRLRRFAGVRFSGERVDHTLQITAVVNESWLRLFKDGPPETRIRSTKHLFCLAAKTVRDVLVDHARSRAAVKRGAGFSRHLLDDAAMAGPAKVISADDLLDLDSILMELQQEDSYLVEVVQLKLFLGLNDSEIASLLDVSPSTVAKHCRFAMAWIQSRLAAGE